MSPTKTATAWCGMMEISQRAEALTAQVTAKNRLRLPPTTARRILGPQCQLEYRPLPTDTSIRLLKIRPLNNKSGIGEDTIECSMEVVDLDKVPLYDTLSYTWGDPKTVYYGPQEPRGKDWVNWSHTIRCDGRPVSVSTNLYHGDARPPLQEGAKSPPTTIHSIDLLIPSGSMPSASTRETRMKSLVRWKS